MQALPIVTMLLSNKYILFLQWFWQDIEREEKATSSNCTMFGKWLNAMYDSNFEQLKVDPPDNRVLPPCQDLKEETNLQEAEARRGNLLDRNTNTNLTPIADRTNLYLMLFILLLLSSQLHHSGSGSNSQDQ